MATARCRYVAQILSDATIFTTFPEVGSALEARAFHAVAERARLTRYGMDCYAYALLAAGQIDLVIEAGLNAYDIQGPIAVIQAAGGVVTDWTGVRRIWGTCCGRRNTRIARRGAVHITRGDQE